MLLANYVDLDSLSHVKKQVIKDLQKLFLLGLQVQLDKLLLCASGAVKGDLEPEIK